MPSVRSQPYGTTRSGEPVERWTVEGPSIRLAVITYGATVESLEVPDRSGARRPAVVSLPDLAAYEATPMYQGATVGRYANRIAHGRFTLDGREHQVPVNDRGHALHGGPGGFHAQVWAAEEVADGVRLTLVSPDGDMGFPGRLVATTTFTVRGSEVLVEQSAVTDAPTVVSLTQHTYFALGPAVAPLQLQVAGSRYLPVDEGSIPVGGPSPVEGTDFDLRTAREVGGSAYDHCWVLDDPEGGPVARLVDPATGRALEVLTDRPGLQVYTGDLLPEPRTGLALEAQALPDTPNHPEWPTYGGSVLRPGEEWTSRTVWRFSVAG